MLNIKHIAVLVDFDQSTHHSLDRAVAIANLFDARVTVITCVYQRSVEFTHLIKEIDAQTIQNETIAHYHNKLSQLIDDAGFASGSNVEVLWNKHFHRGVVDYLNQAGFDLIIKNGHKHSPLEKLFTPTDWHLLREAHAPILFVKYGHWPRSSNVLGAINIDSDPAHQTLNQGIIESTTQLAKLCGGQPHLLNVFPWPLIDIDQLNHLVKGEDHFYKIRDTHKAALMDYVKDKDFNPENLHVAEGLTPQETIPGVIKATQSDLLVIGCVGRSGLKGFTIGNTAEKVLDEIQCEVLALK